MSKAQSTLLFPETRNAPTATSCEGIGSQKLRVLKELLHVNHYSKSNVFHHKIVMSINVTELYCMYIKSKYIFKCI